MNATPKMPMSRMRRLAISILGAAVSFAAGIPATLHAQSATPPTREELGIGNETLGRADSESRIVVEGDIERGPCPLADPALAETTVNFSNVTFANLQTVSPTVLATAWQGYAGRDLPVSSLCEIRDRAATMLRQMGYLAAVQIPPQRIERGGELRMDVLVARLVETQVRGDAGRSEKLISAYLAKLAKQEWFNVQEAERLLLLLGDMPGYDVRLRLRPAKGAPGDVIGDVLVEFRPVEFSAGIQNLGSKATGRVGFSGQLVINGMTGLGDRTSFSLFNTFDLEKQTVIQISHDMALGSDGLRLGGKFTYGMSEPGGGVSGLETETHIGTIEASYPIKRSQRQSSYLSGGIDIVEQTIDFASTPLSKDKLRVLFAGIAMDMTDRASLTGRLGYSAAEPKWRLASSLEARLGIDGLGASRDCDPITDCLSPNVPISNFRADPSAFVIRGQALMEYRPDPRFTLAIAPRFQYSDDALLSFEQFNLGNYTIGRGVDPGAVLGDKGVGSSFEVRYGKIMPRSADSIALQPFGFLDAAWAWANKDGIGGADSVVSAGAGVRGRWGNRMDANLVLAAPLKRVGLQTEKGDVRLLFTIRAKLIPWRP